MRRSLRDTIDLFIPEYPPGTIAAPRKTYHKTIKNFIDNYVVGLPSGTVLYAGDIAKKMRDAHGRKGDVTPREIGGSFKCRPDMARICSGKWKKI